MRENLHIQMSLLGYERYLRDMEIMEEIMRLLEDDVGDLLEILEAKKKRRREQKRSFLVSRLTKNVFV